MQFGINYGKLPLFQIADEYFKPLPDWDFFHSISSVLFEWELFPGKIGKRIWLIAKNEFFNTVIAFPLSEQKEVIKDFHGAVKILFDHFQLADFAQKDYLKLVDNACVTPVRGRSALTVAKWKEEYQDLIKSVVSQILPSDEEILEINRLLIESGKSDLEKYFAELVRFYAIYFDGTEGNYKRLLLDVTLHAGREKIVRELEVPASLTFEEFHRVLQIAFNWDDAHLHEFVIPENPEKLMDSTAQALCRIKMADDEDWDFGLNPDEQVFDENQMVLAQMFTAVSGIQYLYDFGDGWFHTIELKKVFNSRKRSSELISKQGLRPPEDIGGYSGFERFKQAVAELEKGKFKETKYRDYGYGTKEDFAEWVKSWKELDFPINITNVLLPRICAIPVRFRRPPEMF